MFTSHTSRVAMGLCIGLFTSAIAAAHPQQAFTPEPPPNNNVDWKATPAPTVTASGAAWQIDGEPVFFAGDWYDPHGSTVFFSESAMIRSSTYRGVPLYVDATVDTYTVVYLPIGGRLMRTYERRASPPSDSASSPREQGREEPTIAPLVAPGTTSAPPLAVPVVKSAGSAEGIWIEFDGARWYSAGPAVEHTIGRFTLIGQSRGFPVYRDTTSTTRRVYVPASNGGLLTPYALH